MRRAKAVILTMIYHWQQSDTTPIATKTEQWLSGSRNMSSPPSYKTPPAIHAEILPNNKISQVRWKSTGANVCIALFWPVSEAQEINWEATRALSLSLYTWPRAASLASRQLMKACHFFLVRSLLQVDGVSKLPIKNLMHTHQHSQGQQFTILGDLHTFPLVGVTSCCITLMCDMFAVAPIGSQNLSVKSPKLLEGPTLLSQFTVEDRDSRT